MLEIFLNRKLQVRSHLRIQFAIPRFLAKESPHPLPRLPNEVDHLPPSRCPAFVIQFPRSATIGSILEARLAGRYPATSATAPSSRIIPAYVIGSAGSVP